MQSLGFLILAALVLQWPFASRLWALAVGDIAVQSRRGEPLRAEIGLTAGPQERDKPITVLVGDQEAYRAEGLPRPAAVNHIRASLTPGSQPTIRLSSAVPMQDAALDLVLHVRSGQVTIVKHYRVAIPGTVAAAPTLPARQAATPMLVSPPPAPKTPPVPKITRTVPVKTAKAPRTTSELPKRYGPIERGETLYGIARTLRVPTDKVWPAVVLIWRANKDKFVGGNLHALHTGVTLDIPAGLEDTLATVHTSEAQEIVANQWDDWQSWQRLGSRQRVIMAGREAAAAEIAAARREAGRTITAAVKPPPAPPTAEKSVPPPAVVLPAEKPAAPVSAGELQTVLQGLEERLLQRLTPASPSATALPLPSTPIQEARGGTSFVSVTDLQASMQNLEDRLTQRMQQMLTQGPEPVRVGQRANGQIVPLASPTFVVDAATQGTPPLIPYMLVLTNVLLLLLAGVALWLWIRRRDRTERPQTFRNHV